MILLTNRSQFPSCIRHHKELVGICVGGCIAGYLDQVECPLDENDEYFTLAHAHSFDIEKFAPLKGYICVRNKTVLRNRQVLLHEVAHLKANTNKFIPNHGAAFKKALRELGGKIDGEYI